MLELKALEKALGKLQRNLDKLRKCDDRFRLEHLEDMLYGCERLTVYLRQCMNLHKHIGKAKKRENFYRTRYYEVMIDTKNHPFIPLYGLADDIKTTLLNLIHNSGEIPSDIYKPLDIKAGTFRAKITQLRQDGLIRRNFEDKVHTYLLTPAGRKRFKIIPPYIRTAADLKTRLRHIRLARLNACLEGLNVTTFLEMNPPLKNFANNQFAQDSLHFYNSYFLKPTVSNNSLGFRRSKAMGVLAGRDNAFMLYYSPEACDFYHEERLFSNFVCDYMNIRYDEMKMMIVGDTFYQASYWLHFLLSQSQFFDGIHRWIYLKRFNCWFWTETQANPLNCCIVRSSLPLR